MPDEKKPPPGNESAGEGREAKDSRREARRKERFKEIYGDVKSSGSSDKTTSAPDFDKIMGQDPYRPK